MSRMMKGMMRLEWIWKDVSFDNIPPVIEFINW
jgi:hypothetical protein